MGRTTFTLTLAGAAPAPAPRRLVGGAACGLRGTGGAENVYYVQPGDTLLNIASRFNTTVATLAQLNGIVNANLIYIGQRLMLPVPATGGAEGGIMPTSPPGLAETAPEEPAPVTYVVQPGDNLYRISLRFNVSIQRLADINGITNYNRIFIGQVLTMPS